MGSDVRPELPLGDLVDVFDSLRVPVKSSDRKPGPYPYYGASGITDYVDSYIFEGEHLLLSEDGDNLRTRNTPIAFLADGKFWVNNHAHILRANEENNTKYLCYALQVADITSYLSGSTRPKLNQKDMRRIPVYAPPLPEQKAIAHILGTLDDKIELNRRMNATLEGMAQALFKSWFVDFDPVIDNALAAGNPIPDELAPRAEVRRQALANGTTQQGPADRPTLSDPQSLFPASFQFTEELGWIPEGWDLTTVGKHVSLQRGTTYKSKLKGFPGPFLLGLGAIQRNGGFKEDKLVTYGGESPEKITLGPGDIFVSLKDLTQAADLLGSVARIPPHIPSGRLTQDTVALVFDKEPISKDYLYNALLTPRYRDYCSSYATGTTNLGLAREDFFSYPIPKPSGQVQSSYDTFVLANQKKHQVNTAEANSLSNLRDTLLSKLISGKLQPTLCNE